MKEPFPLFLQDIFVPSLVASDSTARSIRGMAFLWVERDGIENPEQREEVVSVRMVKSARRPFFGRMLDRSSDEKDF